MLVDQYERRVDVGRSRGSRGHVEGRRGRSSCRGRLAERGFGGSMTRMYELA